MWVMGGLVVCHRGSGAKESPVNRLLQGTWDGVEVLGGWCGSRYGCLGVSQMIGAGGVVVVSSPECMRMKKKPVNGSLLGWW